MRQQYLKDLASVGVILCFLMSAATVVKGQHNGVSWYSPLFSPTETVAPHEENNPAKAYDGSEDRLHVYLLIGQSNMAGRAPYTKQEAEFIDRCYLLNDDAEWEPAKNPLNRYSTIRKGLNIQKMNPGYSFSKEMLAKDKDILVGLVVNAKGGTAIRQWEKGTKFYNEAVRRAEAAQETGTLKGVLWHQGESDNTRPSGYLKKLVKLVENLREDLGRPDLPFVAGQVREMESTKEINNKISELPNTLEFTGVASSEGLTTMDKWHFDSESMKLLGKRYAEEIQKIQRSVKAE